MARMAKGMRVAAKRISPRSPLVRNARLHRKMAVEHIWESGDGCEILERAKGFRSEVVGGEECEAEKDEMVGVNQKSKVHRQLQNGSREVKHAMRGAPNRSFYGAGNGALECAELPRSEGKSSRIRICLVVESASLGAPAGEVNVPGSGGDERPFCIFGLAGGNPREGATANLKSWKVAVAGAGRAADKLTLPVLHSGKAIATTSLIRLLARWSSSTLR